MNEMKDYLRSYCFSSLDLHQNHNLKNKALIWVTYTLILYTVLQISRHIMARFTFS